MHRLIKWHVNLRPSLHINPMLIMERRSRRFNYLVILHMRHIVAIFVSRFEFSQDVVEVGSLASGKTSLGTYLFPISLCIFIISIK